MPELQIPFPLKELPLKPEMTGRIKVDETLIQTLSALMGYDGEGRRLLKCMLNGSLNVVSPAACCIINKATVAGNEDISFGDIPTTEVIIMAGANNGGTYGLMWTRLMCLKMAGHLTQVILSKYLLTI